MILAHIWLSRIVYVKCFWQSLFARILALAFNILPEEIPSSTSILPWPSTSTFFISIWSQPNPETNPTLFAKEFISLRPILVVWGNGSLARPEVGPKSNVLFNYKEYFQDLLIIVKIEVESLHTFIPLIRQYHRRVYPMFHYTPSARKPWPRRSRPSW